MGQRPALSLGEEALADEGWPVGWWHAVARVQRFRQASLEPGQRIA